MKVSNGKSQSGKKLLRGPNNSDYRKLVGKGWDIYAAHQFNVLISLGLKGNHTLLDIGCGGLRGGRLFIAFLEKGNYYGIEPASWAVKDAIKNELGQEYIKKRRPSFDYNSEANISVFNRKFDFILTHSVLVHAPKIWVEKCFNEVKKVLKPDGKFVANIIFRKIDSNETTWEYPFARYHSIGTIKKLADQARLNIELTKIEHPSKDGYTWVILTHK